MCCKCSSINGIEKYPKLRFRGYLDGWREIYFRNLFSYIPSNTLSRAELNYESGEYKNVHYGDVLIKYGPVLDAASEEIPYISGDKEGKGNCLLRDGDIIIADTAEDETVGKATEIVNIGTQKIVSGLHTIACHPTIEMAHTYLGFYINSEKYHSQLYSLMQGVKVLSISKSNIEGTVIRYPCFTEQKKICTLLNLLQNRIAKQHKIIECLKKYKRGVVKTLLDPKQNQRQGVIWTTDTIGNLGTFIKGAALSKADISDSGTPFILYGELYTTYKEVVRTVVRTTQANVDDVYLSKVGDVVIPTSGETPEEISTASCIMVPDVILAGDLNIYRSTVVDGRIMSYLLNHIVNEQIARVAQGKSVVHIQASEIGKILIRYPDHEEQERIAQILELLDTRIAISEKVLSSMQKMKKALLQQLFI